jgi:hypothetical protein
MCVYLPIYICLSSYLPVYLYMYFIYIYIYIYIYIVLGIYLLACLYACLYLPLYQIACHGRGTGPMFQENLGVKCDVCRTFKVNVYFAAVVDLGVLGKASCT